MRDELVNWLGRFLGEVEVLQQLADALHIEQRLALWTFGFRCARRVVQACRECVIGDN
jgi:hypothetical protein